MPLLNAYCTLLLNWVNLYILPGDEEFAQPTPPPPPPHPRASNSSQSSSSHDYPAVRTILWAIQEEQASL